MNQNLEKAISDVLDQYDQIEYDNYEELSDLFDSIENLSTTYELEEVDIGDLLYEEEIEPGRSPSEEGFEGYKEFESE